jgi:hypothetical protein
VLGGGAEAIAERVGAAWVEGSDLATALGWAVTALAGPDRRLGPGDVEVAVLSRQNGRRAFRRITNGELAELLGDQLLTDDAPTTQAESSDSAPAREGDDGAD